MPYEKTSRVSWLNLVTCATILFMQLANCLNVSKQYSERLLLVASSITHKLSPQTLFAKKKIKAGLLGLVLMLVMVTPAYADDPTITVNRVQPDFPAGLTFHLTVSGETAIETIALEYGAVRTTCSQVKAIVRPAFEPDGDVSVRWTWDLRRSGSIPPGTLIWWRWRIKDAAGAEIETERQEIIFDDPRYTWQETRSEEMVLFSAVTDPAVNETLWQTANTALDQLEEELGSRPAEVVKIYNYPDPETLREAILYTQSWTGGLAFTGYSTLLLGVNENNLDWGKQAMTHELTHLIVHQVTARCGGGLPTWLDEGLAEYMEGDFLEEERRLFETAVADDALYPLRVLGGAFPTDGGEAGLAYIQSNRVVAYLLESYGPEKMAALLQAFQAGSDDDEALQQVYGFDALALDNEWRESLSLRPHQTTPTPTPTTIPTIALIIPTPPAPSTALSAATPTPATTPTRRPTLTSTPSPPLTDSPPLPTPTPTWPPPATATPTVVPPSPLPPTPTKAVVAPPPTPTLIATPTPEAGYYGDPALGFGFYYPTTWVAEETDGGVFIQSEDLGVWVGGFSELLDTDKTIEDSLTELYEIVLENPAAVEVISDTTTSLWDGAEARIVEFTEPDALFKARATLAQQKQRLFTILIVAPRQTFEQFPETLNAIAASLKIEAPQFEGIPRQNALMIAGGQPRTLDPALTQGSAGGSVGAIFSGLVMLNETLQVAPDLAERWEVSPDGAVYTFHLRPEAVFHNGRPVVAPDVKFSWERAADPVAGSDTVATYLGDIVGVKAKLAGEAETIAGVEVIDDHTLQVTIDAPKPYFLAKLTYPTAFIVDEQNVKSADWEHQPNGTGPFRLRAWEDDRLIILERNDRFYQEPARLEHIITVMYQDAPVRMYENGEIDIAGVGLNDYERITDPDNPLSEETYHNPALCTSRLILDVTRPPFDDPLVRQAFAYAVDRDKLTEDLLEGRARPAQSILPPGMPGYNPEITAPNFDPDKARDLLARSGYGQDLPEIVYTTSGFGGSLGDYDEMLLAMWREHLGVDVTVEQLEPINFVEEVREQHGHIIDSGWCADYPDPQNFLDILYHSESSDQNLGGYSNPEVDALLEEARTEPNVDRRLALYHQVEQMIIDDAPDILLHQSNGSHILIKPYINNYPLTPIFPASAWRTMSISKQ